MSLVESESLILKTYNLAEADKIVVFLTRNFGVVRGVAKGAKRLKSKFGSGLEPFSKVNATFLQKDSTELVSIQRIDLVRSNFAAASNPDFLQKFAYLADLLITLSPPYDPNETLYRMVNACVEVAASNSDALLSTLVYFEIWIARLAGYLPDWGRCDGCGRPLDAGEEANLQANFSLICTECRRGRLTRPFDSNARVIAATAMRLSPIDFSLSSTKDREALEYLSIVLKLLISASVGREITGEISLALR
jgi:DNA repair protein RecO (recombination protein O)